ncbi:hypothetical protein BTJ40_10650 [Microbulbifer sp. A4B17]|uniref:hypothetical protein n=1 Tax=Microbulbifer sp. A4B17 TaxID=359370 RepID=UPI000D52C9C7|nr:hypothetical protein [Microbulbifer sp. A4B17]AWF81241.1 hypothetical protein BTJ40_10650 [Microbulbifer sp. A4B17]
MRLILVLIISVSLGKLAYIYNPTWGTNLILFLFVTFGALPYIALLIRSNYFRKEIKSWAENNNIKVLDIQNNNLFKGKLRWKVSDIQDVFLLKGCDAEYWIACGTWFLGSFKCGLKIYKESNGHLKIVASL